MRRGHFVMLSCRTVTNNHRIMNEINVRSSVESFYQDHYSATPTFTMLPEKTAPV